MHPRAHGVEVGEQILLRLDLLQAHLLQKLLLLERALGDADAAQTAFGRAISNEGKLLHVLVRVNARALQSALELLQDVRQDLVFEGARRWRIAQCAVIDGDDLLDRRWNHGTGIAAQRRRNCGQAENGAQKKACEELLHTHNSTRQSAKRCGIVSVRCFYCTSTAGEQRFRR